ncbi:MAG: DUF3592 domain-containing protein [Clostridia bacterium]|nr:DUF3592 domain-containing protein [Clostridia bacterium]
MIPALVLGLFIIVGVIFLIIGICISHNAKKKYKKCTIITSAKVLKNVRESFTDIDMHTTYTMHPVFEYHVGEETIKKEYLVGTSKIKYQEGQVVNIFYNPKKPTMFYVQGDKLQSTLGKVFTIVGIVCICTAIVSGIIVTAAVNSIL